MAKQKKSLRRKPITKIGRDAKTGQYFTVREARSRPNTTVVERVSLPRPSSKYDHFITPSTGRLSLSDKGEPLPPRDPKTGSFTTSTSTAAIKMRRGSGLENETGV